MEKPLISIIIPVYKVEKYLERCIKSVLDKTYKKQNRSNTQRKWRPF